MLNAERWWRQTITIYSSGHALKEKMFFLSSISFKRIQVHIFYKTVQDFEFSGETLKWNVNDSSLLVLTSGQYWGFQLNTPFFLEATLLGM